MTSCLKPFLYFGETNIGQLKFGRFLLVSCFCSCNVSHCTQYIRVEHVSYRLVRRLFLEDNVIDGSSFPLFIDMS